MAGRGGRERGQFKRAEREGNEGSQFVEPAPRQGRSGPPRLVSDWEAWGGGGYKKAVGQGRGTRRPRAGVRITIRREEGSRVRWSKEGRRWMDGQSLLGCKEKEILPGEVSVDAFCIGNRHTSSLGSRHPGSQVPPASEGDLR